MASEQDSIAGQGAPVVRPTRRNGWYESATPDRYVLARQWPPRFDLRAETRFPAADRRRLAMQVRQDLWRELKRLRGFAPVIQIDARDEGLILVAGGQLAAAAPADSLARLRTLLASPARRSRWLTWARERAA